MDNHQASVQAQHPESESNPNPVSTPTPTAEPVASTSTSSNQGLGIKDQSSTSSNTFYSTHSNSHATGQDLTGAAAESAPALDQDGGGVIDENQDEKQNRPSSSSSSSSSVESSFVPTRPRNQVSSILPPAAFFAPKRKQQSQSPTWGFANLPSTNNSTTPTPTTSNNTSNTTSNNHPNPFSQHPLSLSRSRSDSRSRQQQRPSSRSSNHQNQSHSHPNSTSHSPTFHAANLPNDSTNSNWKPDSHRPNSPWGVASTIQSFKRDSQDDSTVLDPYSSSDHLKGSNLDPKALQSYYKKGSLKTNKYSREPLLDVDKSQNNVETNDRNGIQDDRIQSPISMRAADEYQNRSRARFSNHLSPSNSGRALDRTSQQDLRKRDSTNSQRSNHKIPIHSLPGHHLTKERNHKSLQGSNRFFLFGLIMTSSDNPLPFLGSLALLLVLGGLFFGFVSPFIWKEVSIAPVIVFAYTWLVATVNMVVTAWRDPGILPRNLDPDPPCSIGESRALDPEDPLAVPLPRMIRIRETDVKVKWCETCGTYRAPRSSHCRVCDNCVENIDHHCTFLNTCIGRRNYFSFFSFLVFCIISAGLCIAFCALHLYYLTRPTDYALPKSGFGRGYSAATAMNKAPVSVLLIALTVVTLFPLFTLFGYHVRLILLNLTTVEQIRISTTKSYDSPSHSSQEGGSDSKPPTCCGLILGGPSTSNHPFGNSSTLKNVLGVLARPTPSSSIERYARRLEDGRRDNPGWKDSSAASSNRNSQLNHPINSSDERDGDADQKVETKIDMNGGNHENDLLRQRDAEKAEN